MELTETAYWQRILLPPIHPRVGGKDFFRDSNTSPVKPRFGAPCYRFDAAQKMKPRAGAVTRYCESSRSTLSMSFFIANGLRM